MSAIYIVTDCRPDDSTVQEFDNRMAALEAATKCYSPTIDSPGWTGYIVGWAETQLGVSCKWFPGADEYGFGGEIPPEAREFAGELAIRRQT